MQSTIRIRRLPRVSKIPRSTIPQQQLVSCFSTQAPKMSVFFPRFHEASPLFRLADELDRAVRHAQQPQLRTFSPKFDVKETKETFELVGELPGIEQGNVNIEWSDEHTIAISGRTESRRESSSENKETKEIKETKPVEPEFEVIEDSASENYHRPSVEDEDAEASSSTEKQAEATESKTETKAVEKEAAPKSRYWVAERSVGSFRRTFTFTGRVDHDAVKASLKNGVLNIVVPKAKPLEPKRVTIN